MHIQIRAATPDDESFLWHMLYEAAHMAEAGESLEMASQNPLLARYVSDWGRLGDWGYLALHPESQDPIAAAWCRVFPPTEPGYGFVQAGIPELAIATLPSFRGKGIGTELLKTLIDQLQDHYPAIVLSVRSNNPAVRLYERLGFCKVPGSGQINRVGGWSFNMRLEW